ncbi:MAG: Sec-independent protein translocase protein TatB [Desulfovibrio sp.]
MFGLGGGEILIILVVALLVLGPEKLPRFMRTVGKAVGELRRASTEFQRTMNLELAEKESSPPAPPQPEPPVTPPSSNQPIARTEQPAPLTAAPRRSPRIRAVPPRKTRR